ncbi:MAG: HAMP domain-containing histidine kinase [Clostridiaceae bacterium]|jgi:signal transduction histidine kinase|nr:HAMP domain-containing histidine kinase [Clostridiaceae bacterium]
MADKYRSSSVYIKTIVSLTLTTVLVFGVLSFLYYQRTSASFLSDKSKDVYSDARYMAVRLQKVLPDLGREHFALNQDEADMLIGLSLGCTIWIVDESGQILYASDIPKESMEQLEHSGGEFYVPEKYLNSFLGPKGGVQNTVKTGMFSDSRNDWITASYPINKEGQYIFLHSSVNVEQQTMSMLANVLALPIGISFAIALILFTLMTRAIVKPIRLLSDAARKVTHGDLSARIEYSEIDKDSPFQYLIVDELGMMITAVNDMIERLERQETDRRVFISSIAHDLRTPLTSVNGFISAIMDGTIPPDKIEKYMQIVKGEVERIQLLTDTMTEATSLANISKENMDLFDINALISETLTNLENQLTAKNLGVQLELFENDKGVLLAYGNRQSILRVLYNILTNAIKFSPRDGNIAITTYFEMSENLITVSVEDSGPGIPNDQKNRIFDSFYKIDQSRTDTGSGLGLFICKEILRAHGQGIRAEDSRDLGGSNFIFTLSGPGERKD